METDVATPAPAAAFREALEEWLESNLTPEVIAAGREGYEDEHTLKVLRVWNQALADAGWAAVSWPSAYGGRDATVEEQLAWHEVMAAAGAPGPVNVIGVSNIAPAIMAGGTEEQKDRFLGPCSEATRSGARGCPSPTPVPTSHRCGPRR